MKKFLYLSLIVLLISSKLSAETCTANLPDSSSYKGECMNSLFNGIGKLTWRDGSYYHGNFKDGLFQGHSKYHHNSGWSREVIIGMAH